jgi:hypothetical protein
LFFGVLNNQVFRVVPGGKYDSKFNNCVKNANPIHLNMQPPIKDIGYPAGSCHITISPPGGCPKDPRFHFVFFQLFIKTIIIHDFAIGKNYFSQLPIRKP